MIGPQTNPKAILWFWIAAVPLAFGGLALAVYALLLSDVPPFSADVHQWLFRLGVAYGDVGVHPIWSRCAAAFGWHAALLSALCGGVAAGLCAHLFHRSFGLIPAAVGGFCFIFSPPVASAATHVGAGTFDAVLLLAALVCVRKDLRIALTLAFGVLLAVDVAAAPTGWRQMLAEAAIPLTLAVCAAVCVAVRWTLRRRDLRPAFAHGVLGGIAALTLVNGGFGLAVACSPVGTLADRLAERVLAQLPAGCSWLVTDAALEDVLAARLAHAPSGPYLLRRAHDRDPRCVSNLVARAATQFPGDMSLRAAAELGVCAFVEDLAQVVAHSVASGHAGRVTLPRGACSGVTLPRGGTNAVAYVWGREIWTKPRLAAVREDLDPLLKNRREPLAGYASQKLKELASPPQATDAKRLDAAFARRLQSLAEHWDGIASRLAADARSGSYAALRDDARGLLRVDRMNPAGNAILGALACAEGAYAAAELHLRRAAACKAAPALVKNDLAEVLRRVGELDEAEVWARQATAEAPKEWRAHETLADILLAKGASKAEIVRELDEAEALSRNVPFKAKQRLRFVRAALAKQGE